ncbi:MAG: insulinase family protein, partial [Gemmatimonadetes bacterium]|nr:insulinase family protein [Gemmatimonadota bacterium]NIR77450.1 insulinase family protein [Gemmatimonadota bacterium]NIT85974.1 insulinase family protein [Gemmatimonadota bacterium]NIU29794.1 insulinase family protein [Gemmatimonadota bacterium]NIU34816.1 insulinase family protein [Gemmatimonadota bacterium]
MPGVRSAAVGVWVRQGAAHEARGEMGASHLLEHLVFKGTRKRSAREIATALEGLGGSLDAYTGREQTSYQARVLHEHVGEALEVLSDLILSPALREEDLERERQVVLEEIAMVEDTPEDVVFELHGERLWEGHPYGRSILGTRETVGSLSTGTLRALHRDRYLRPDLVVAAAGHVGHDAVVGQVRDLLGHLNGNGGRPGVPEPSARRGGQEAVSRETAQTHVVFGTDAPPHSDPRRFGLVLLSAAFGGGMSSRLFQKVREELALA